MAFQFQFQFKIVCCHCHRTTRLFIMIEMQLIIFYKIILFFYSLALHRSFAFVFFSLLISASTIVINVAAHTTIFPLVYGERVYVQNNKCNNFEAYGRTFLLKLKLNYSKKETTSNSKAKRKKLNFVKLTATTTYSPIGKCR